MESWLKVFIQEALNPGYHTFNWKPVDISSGKYFIRFESHEINDVIEIIYLK